MNGFWHKYLQFFIRHRASNSVNSCNPGSKRWISSPQESLSASTSLPSTPCCRSSRRTWSPNSSGKLAVWPSQSWTVSCTWSKRIASLASTLLAKWAMSALSPTVALVPSSRKISDWVFSTQKKWVRDWKLSKKKIPFWLKIWLKCSIKIYSCWLII